MQTCSHLRSTCCSAVNSFSRRDVSAQSSRIKAHSIEASRKGRGSDDAQIERDSSSIVTVAADASPSAGGEKADRNNGAQSPLHESPSSSEVEKGLPSRPPLVLSEKQGEPKAKSNHFTAIAVCVAGAVMSSMLQFAFVYGALRISRWIRFRVTLPLGFGPGSVLMVVRTDFVTYVMLSDAPPV